MYNGYMKLITIDIKSERQTVREAIAQFLTELEAYQKGGFKVMKVIHGYGSHGVGGAIRTELMKILRDLKNRKKIVDYIPGNEWPSAKQAKKMAINYCPDLLADSEMSFVNSGVTIVIM